ATSSGPVTSNSYSACKNQLLVHGNFLADKIKLGRTFGSLRDEEPNPGTPAGQQLGLVWSCRAGDCNPPTAGMRCTNISESADFLHTWNDNKLCVPNNSPLQLAWTSFAGNPIEGGGLLDGLTTITGGRSSLGYLKTHGYP